MKRKTRNALLAGAVVVGVAGVGTATGAASGADTDTPINGSALTEASRAALAHTGGGTVTDTEQGDEDSYYEVEVTLADGSQTDVQLDERFQVVAAAADHEESGDTDAD